MPAKIALVEDNPADVEIIRFLLSQWNSPVELVVFGTGESLLSQLETYPGPFHLHLILLDLNLPGIPGMEIINRLKNHPEWNRIPLVVFTSSSYPPEIEEAYRRGANGYVCKPLDLADLENLLKGILHFWTEVNTLA